MLLAGLRLCACFSAFVYDTIYRRDSGVLDACCLLDIVFNHVVSSCI